MTGKGNFKEREGQQSKGRRESTDTENSHCRGSLWEREGGKIGAQGSPCKGKIVMEKQRAMGTQKRRGEMKKFRPAPTNVGGGGVVGFCCWGGKEAGYISGIGKAERKDAKTTTAIGQQGWKKERSNFW